MLGCKVAKYSFIYILFLRYYSYVSSSGTIAVISLEKIYFVFLIALFIISISILVKFN